MTKTPDEMEREVMRGRTPVDVEVYILKLMNDYHSSLLSNDEDALYDTIDGINKVMATWHHPCLSSYINEASILAVYDIFNKIADDDFNVRPSAKEDAAGIKLIDMAYTRELYSVVVKNHLDFKMFKEDVIANGIDEYYDVLSEIMNPDDLKRLKTHSKMIRKLDSYDDYIEG